MDEILERDAFLQQNVDTEFSPGLLLLIRSEWTSALAVLTIEQRYYTIRESIIQCNRYPTAKPFAA